MKKIGIVTYWDTKDNYGSILQNYALQTFLKTRGFEPELIRIKTNSKKNIKDLFILLKKNEGLVKACVFILTYPLRYILKKNFEKKQNKRNFSVFQNRNLNMTKIFDSYNELKNSTLSYDLLIAGSDQIWNFYDYSLTDAYNLIHTYFLDFGNSDIKRISCAASFGKDSINKNHIDEIKPLIQKFDFVSVREEYGIDLCKILGVDKSVKQEDPTFLLDTKHYELLADSVSVKQRRKYVLLYLLSNNCDFNLPVFYKWASDKDLDVVYVSGNDSLRNKNKYSKEYSTVEEWLSLIKNAEYVFTNSFHGTIFCIKFNKQFLTILQSGKFVLQNARINSLLQAFNLKDRLFSGLYDAISSVINYDVVNQQMKLIQSESPFVKYIEREVAK